MHGPCGHVCAKVAAFTWLLPTTTMLPLTAPNHHCTPKQQRQRGHLTSRTGERQPSTTDGDPPDQPNGRTVTTGGEPPHQSPVWTNEPPHQPNGHGDHRRQTTSPAQRTNNNNGWRATPPAQRTKDNDSDQLVNGRATTPRRWRRMLSSLSVNLGEHHDSPPHLLYSHENQGAMPPSATWQLTLGFLLLTTLPTPGLCPTSPLRASACRAAMGSFI